MYSGSGRSWSTSGQGNGSYHYRVRACYSSTCEAWGTSATETVLHPPASAPTLSAPYVATMGKEFPVSWTAVSTTTNYELEQSYAENFSGVSPVSEDSALSTYETPRTEASPYYLFYRVRACNAGGCSGWSNVKQVTVNPNLQCTRPPCHPVGGGGPLTKPTVKASGSGPSGGGDPAVTWNALGEAQTIVTGSTTIHLTYGPDGGLVDTSGAYGGRYFGRWLKWQSNTQWSARIIVNGQVVAVVKDSAGSVATSYLVAGPLGSTRAVANASGSLTQRIAYSAWGKFVSPENGADPVSAASIAATTTVTYTGHELLAAAGLINMGARLYDPATGLFMSPDPTLMQPFNTQDLNQYAYVGDNPMTFVDPWGYCPSTGTPPGSLCSIILTGQPSPINPEFAQLFNRPGSFGNQRHLRPPCSVVFRNCRSSLPTKKKPHSNKESKKSKKDCLALTGLHIILSNGQSIPIPTKSRTYNPNLQSNILTGAGTGYVIGNLIVFGSILLLAPEAAIPDLILHAGLGLGFLGGAGFGVVGGFLGYFATPPKSLPTKKTSEQPAPGQCSQ